MNENIQSDNTTSAEQIAENSEILEQAPLTQDQISLINPDYRNSPLFQDVANFYRLSNDDYDTAKYKLSLIVDWATQKARSERPQDILKIIGELDRSLPPPEPGERRYLNAFRFVKLAQQK